MSAFKKKRNGNKCQTLILAHTYDADFHVTMTAKALYHSLMPRLLITVSSHF